MLFVSHDLGDQGSELVLTRQKPKEEPMQFDII